MSEADVIVVTDTGSTDDTIAMLEKRGAIVYSEKIDPWRFDVARNLSLNHVPDDVDICLCTDLDEVASPGWRAHLEAAWQSGTTIGRYLFNWSYKDGKPDVQFTGFKAHSRHGYKWAWPVHECLKYVGWTPEKAVFVDGMVLSHYPDPTKSRSSYLPLLELAVEEDPQSDRMAYYLGREYMYNGMWEQCIETLKKYLTLKTATWKEERCASMRWIAKSYHQLGKITEATSWYYRAIAEVPNMRDAYVECARMAYQVENWPMTFFMVEEAMKITAKSSVYINMGYAWDHTPDDLCAIACYWLGMYEKSAAHARAALTFSPEDKRLKANLQLIEAKL